MMQRGCGGWVSARCGEREAVRYRGGQFCCGPGTPPGWDWRGRSRVTSGDRDWNKGGCVALPVSIKANPD